MRPQMLKSLITPTEPVPASRLGRVHFAGIGGAGMSGIARIMLARGIVVSGSDAMPSALLDDLSAHGARVHIGHASANLGELAAGDTLVLSSAIARTTPNWPRRPGGACGSSTGPRRWPRSWPGGG